MCHNSPLSRLTGPSWGGEVNEARQALAADARFVFLNLDAQAVPLPTGCFDVVIANPMLYHVPHLPRAVPELARVLKKRWSAGGIHITKDVGIAIGHLE